MTGIGIVIHEAVIQASFLDKYSEVWWPQAAHAREKAEDCWQRTHAEL